MIKAISLFSGAGGLDVGVERAGIKIALCVENDPDSAATLRLNNKNKSKEIFEGDIADVSFKKFARLRDDFIVVGGPPCQPFSKNGYWVKNKNRLIERDPRNLISEFLRCVSEAKPRGFIFENVESLLHPTNKATLIRFLAAAEKLGYKCTLTRANSADFGVPQKRKRIFVFGVRKAKSPISAPLPTHADESEIGFLSKLEPHVGVGKFIAPFAGQKYFEQSEIANHGTYFKELKSVPPGRNYIALKDLKNYSGRTFRTGGRFWNFLHKLHPDEPSITIAAQPGPWVGPFHWDNRRLRIPEAAAIQMFPKNYKFVGNRRSVQKQIGNAVPCLLAKAMVEHLLEHL
jgi:DNA (cytosine-5)-methyltransferase 1